jgi:hypothetical protein
LAACKRDNQIVEGNKLVRSRSYFEDGKWGIKTTHQIITEPTNMEQIRLGNNQTSQELEDLLLKDKARK